MRLAQLRPKNVNSRYLSTGFDYVTYQWRIRDNIVFLMRKYRLIFALRMFDVIKTNINPRRETLIAYMPTLGTANFQGTTINIWDSPETKTLYCYYILSTSKLSFEEKSLKVAFWIFSWTIRAFKQIVERIITQPIWRWIRRMMAGFFMDVIYSSGYFRREVNRLKVHLRGWTKNRTDVIKCCVQFKSFRREGHLVVSCTLWWPIC